jgi:hypothetical protein
LINAGPNGTGAYGGIRFVDPNDGTLIAGLMNATGAAAETVADHPVLHTWFGRPTSSTVYIGSLQTGPDDFNSSAHSAELIMLHELGHVLSNLNWKGDQIVPDANRNVNQANTTRVENACGKYLDK